MSRYPSPLIHASRAALPMLLSVPHAGRHYDDATLANARQGLPSLESLEDPIVDRLCWRAIAQGIGAVIQPVARAVIDCNRDEHEVDPSAILGISPAPVGPRARHGLGLVPSRTHRHGALWRHPIDRAELERRIAEIHRPYHQAVADRLEELVVRFGDVVLIDCHSMPARKGQAQIVIGDRHGKSAAPWLTDQALWVVRQAGFTAALNEPYAGGAIIDRHGCPEEGVHALQLEIDRSVYLAADGRTAGLGFDRLAALIETIAVSLGEFVLARDVRVAAE